MPSLVVVLSTVLIFLPIGVTSDMQSSSPSELRRLVTLSRHGSRAPNGVIERICPKNIKNLKLYSVPEEQLTQYGMQQLVNVGEHIRSVYTEDKKFLSSSLNGVNHSHFETYFRSDAATRCAQSAISLGYGLYPDGTGPPGFPKQPLPVTMQLVQNEHDFAAPKGPCKRVLIEDMIAYANTRAPELLAQYNDTITKVGDLCGVDLQNVATMQGGEDIVLAIKDIADMLIFDRQNKLEPLKGVTSELSTDLETLAFTNLMERYYSTDRTITYWNGGFPTMLLNNLNGAANTRSPALSQYRYYSYHGHRELLHGLGKMLGWKFQFEGLPSALGMTSLHPGTTMFFELHARKNPLALSGEDYFVRMYNYSPNTKREQVKLEKCSHSDCPLDEFNAIIKNHIARTGTWEQICNYEGAGNTKVSGGPTAVKAGADNDTKWIGVTNGSFIVVAGALCAALIYGVVNVIIRMRNFRRRGYTSL